MRWPTIPWLAWALASSVVLHGVAYASLGISRPRSSHKLPASEVTFEVAKASEPEPPPPEPPKEPEPTAPIPVAPARPTPAPAFTAPEPPKAEAAPSAPLDLSGVTLTNEGSPGGFDMPTGNGLAFRGPIGGARARSEAPIAPAPAPTARREPELVALADLSSRPVPPALEGDLRRHYPEEARRRAIGGSARVRARLDPDGVVRRVVLVGETFGGFGDACRKVLRGSRWSAPRDRAGRAVATEIFYTCRFEVGQ